MSRILVRLLIASVVSGTLISAQVPDYILKVDVPFVSVDLTVTDSEGKTITDLPEDAFELYENGLRQEIRYFASVSTPYNILLLFDRSGSTQDKWPLMQRAVAGFIAGLRPRDQIAIAGFDSEFKMLLAWTADRQRSLRILPELIQGTRIGGTQFYSAVSEALRREFPKPLNRRAIVVLTDGRDTSLYKYAVDKNRILQIKEDRPFSRALRVAASQRIPTYFVAFNTDKNLEPNVLGGDEYRSLRIIFPNSPISDEYVNGVRLRMERLAETSGGRMFYPQRLEDIVPLYQEIARELGTSYTLGYVSSNPAADGSFRKIEVRAHDSGLKLTLSRNGYYAKQ